VSTGCYIRTHRQRFGVGVRKGRDLVLGSGFGLGVRIWSWGQDLVLGSGFGLGVRIWSWGQDLVSGSGFDLRVRIWSRGQDLVSGSGRAEIWSRGQESGILGFAKHLFNAWDLMCPS